MWEICAILENLASQQIYAIFRTAVFADCVTVSLSLVSSAVGKEIGSNEANPSPAPQFEVLKNVDWCEVSSFERMSVTCACLELQTNVCNVHLQTHHRNTVQQFTLLQIHILQLTNKSATVFCIHIKMVIGFCMQTPNQGSRNAFPTCSPDSRNNISMKA